MKSAYNILTIIQFEILSQITKKSFWILSFLPPLAFIILFAVNFESHKIPMAGVINDSPLQISEEMMGNTEIRFLKAGAPIDSYFDNDPDMDALCVIDLSASDSLSCQLFLKNNNIPAASVMLFKKNLELEYASLKGGKDFQNTYSHFLSSIDFKESYISPSTMSYRIIALASVFLIYLIVLQFAGSILKVIGKEKRNKIYEVLLSAMSSRSIIGGKLIANIILCLFQVLLWIIFSITVIVVFDKLNIIGAASVVNSIIKSILLTISTSELLNFAGVFFILLIGGLLLYSTLYAIVGFLADDNVNTQQLALVLTLPLLASFMYVFSHSSEHSELLYFLSVFPMTSPVALPIAVANGCNSTIVWISAVCLMVSDYLLFLFACELYNNNSKSVSLLNRLINRKR